METRSAHPTSQFGWPEADLLAGRAGAPFVKLMAFQCDRARSYYEKAAGLLPAEERPAMLAAEIMGAIYRRILAKIEARPARVFDETVGVSVPTKLSIALGLWARKKWRRSA